MRVAVDDARDQLSAALAELWQLVHGIHPAVYGHAQAIAVEVRCDDGVLQVAVEDGGDGGAAMVPGGGLAGRADRVRALGGEFGLSEPVGGGTGVWARIPVAEEVA